MDPGESPATAGSTARSQPQRPLWIVATLTFLTFGGYTPIWLGVTWAEMKKALDDDRMHPFWHALACLVPIYGLFKFCGHYSLIESLAAQAGHRMRISAVVATILAVFTTVPGGNGQPIPEPLAVIVLVLCLAAAAVRAWIIVEGQAALNARWRSVPNDHPRAHVAWWEWALLPAGLIWFVLIVYGILAPE
jgi:hypothetical protein